ncbi:MAG TPA: hypothetical protein VLE93_02955 [Candidatus Saccharimonadales bacterium]|nr:hypothetical protein [Candidatus Saccharimonadales bacterium]
MHILPLTGLIVWALCFVVAFAITAAYCDADGGDKWYEPGGFICCVGAGIFSPLALAFILVIWLLVTASEVLATAQKRLASRAR